MALRILRVCVPPTWVYLNVCILQPTAHARLLVCFVSLSASRPWPEARRQKEGFVGLLPRGRVHLADAVPKGKRVGQVHLERAKSSQYVWLFFSPQRAHNVQNKIILSF